MAKLVTKFRYYKPGGRKKIGGYAKYIALRDGVERCDDSKKYAPVSYNQKQLIAKILRDYPDSAEMLEYDDYKQHPTVGNASEFISRAIEDNAHSAMRQKTYADYIATRPRAEKVGSHGLFSDEDGEIVLSEVAADLNTHEGNVWTMIVSLRREDAERLGYNNVRAWQMLLRSHTQELADALRIPLEDLKWYGAFHNESHHPHIHVIAYTDDPKVGYLSKNGVEQMRSALGNHIFRDDLQHIFREQTEKRNELKKDWHALLEKILADMAENPNTHPEIEARLAELSLRLSRTKGKKVYGYLKRDIKDLIDEIVDLLAEDENIAKLYDLWYEKKYEALRTYTSEMPPKIPLSQNKEFKSIKNDIIREAMRMSQSGEQKQESQTDSDTTSHHGSEKKLHRIIRQTPSVRQQSRGFSKALRIPFGTKSSGTMRKNSRPLTNVNAGRLKKRGMRRCLCSNIQLQVLYRQDNKIILQIQLFIIQAQNNAKPALLVDILVQHIEGIRHAFCRFGAFFDLNRIKNPVLFNDEVDLVLRFNCLAILLGFLLVLSAIIENTEFIFQTFIDK